MSALGVNQTVLYHLIHHPLFRKNKHFFHYVSPTLQKYIFFVCFGVTHLCVLCLLLGVHSGIAPGGTWRAKLGVRDWTKSAAWKANTMPRMLLLKSTKHPNCILGNYSPHGFSYAPSYDITLGVGKRVKLCRTLRISYAVLIRRRDFVFSRLSGNSSWCLLGNRVAREDFEGTDQVCPISWVYHRQSKLAQFMQSLPIFCSFSNL